MTPYLPTEIMSMIIGYLPIEHQYECITILHLPQRIPKKLNKFFIDQMNIKLNHLNIIQQLLSYSTKNFSKLNKSLDCLVS